MKNNYGLAEHCKMALGEGWFYGWGAYGQIATPTLIDKLIKQYPDNEKWRGYMMKAIGKTKISDCYGLVKSYLWWDDASNKTIYNANQDMNTKMAFESAKYKGSIKNMPELIGTILYMKGHVGIYTGNDEFIECVGGIGMRKGIVKGGIIKKGSQFTNWFRDKNINYEVELKDKNEINAQEKINVKKLNIEVDGDEYIIDSFLYNNFNYVSLRELANLLNFKVYYDENKKTPILKKI